MINSSEQIAEEIAHKQHVLDMLHRNRRQLEVQAVQQGAQPDLRITNELTEIIEKIRSYEEELRQLNTEAAVDQFSLAEADYRAALAKAWHTCPGQIGIVDRAALDLKRLRLGILPERAHDLEREIRAALTEELFYTIDPGLIPRGDWIDRDDPVRKIGRIVRLDPRMAIRLLLCYNEADIREALQSSKDTILRTNNVWPNTQDYAVFEQFFVDLQQVLGEREADLGPPPDRSLIY